LGDIHLPNRLHALLTFLLLLEEFALTGDVAAVALGGHVLAHGADVFAGYDLAADSSLDGNLIELGRDDILELGSEGTSAAFSLIAMHDAGEGIDGFTIDEHLKLHKAISAIAGRLIIEGTVSSGHRFDLVVEIDQDLVERQDGRDHDALGVDGVGRLHHAALIHHDLHDVADILIRDHHKALHDRFPDLLDDAHVGKVRGVVDLEDLAIGLHHLVDDARVGGDDVHVVLAAQALDDDLHVEESEESAAESEAERDGTFGHVVEGGVVDLKLAHGRLELLEVGRIDRVDTAEDHRLDFLEAGKGLGCRLLGIGEGVADFDFSGALDVADEVAHVPGAHGLGSRHLRGEDTDLLDLVGLVGRHEADLHAGLNLTGEDSDVADDTAVGIEERVEDQRTKGSIALGRRGDTRHDTLEDLLDPDTGLGAGGNGFLGGNRQQVLELLFDGREVGVGKVDLVDDRDDGELLLVGQVDVGHRLRLDALGRIDDQDRTFTGGKAPGDLVGEVDMARGVHEIERVLLTILGPVLHGDRVGLDRDAAFAFQVHRVEDLLLLVAVGDRVGDLKKTVRQGGLPVVDVGNDAEVTGIRDGHGEQETILEQARGVNS